LYSWRDKYDWKGRAARAEAEERKVKDAVMSDEARMIASLEAQKDRYEKYFESLGPQGADHQAIYAYTNLVKTIVDIKEKIQAQKASLFLDFMKDLIEWLSRNEPDSVDAIEKVFDDYVAYAREKYGT
ncbi:MAG: hypothetical protein GXP63_06350, partial [DPANN group archaeon]|nr:hypothetical protein [DPANN group archaeon]